MMEMKSELRDVTSQMKKNKKYETCQNGDIKSKLGEKVRILSLYLAILRMVRNEVQTVR